MAEPTRITLEDFTGGINLESPSVSLKPNETDLMLNVIVQDKKLKPRPGCSALHVTGFNGPIYDMVPFGQETSIGGVAKLFIIYRNLGVGNNAYLGYLNGYTVGGETDLASLGAVDTNYAAQMTKMGVYDPSRSGGILWASIFQRVVYINATGGAPATRTSTTMPAAAKDMLTGMWHRSHLFVGQPNLSLIARHYIYRSSYGTPETFAADGTIVLHQSGVEGAVMGCVTAGDIGYFMKANGISIVTGYDKESFHYDQIMTRFAGGYSRGFARVGSNLIGFAVTEDGPPDGPLQEARVRLHTVIGIAGQRVDDIGGRISPAFPTGRLNKEGCLAMYWARKNWVVMIPTINRDAAADTDVFVLDLDTNSWWRWEFPSAIAPCSMTYLDGNLLIGTVDGKVWSFNDSTSTDAGASINAYWTSSWVGTSDGRTIAADSITLTGRQDSGGDCIVSVAVNGSAAFTEVGRACLRHGQLDFATPTISGVGLINGALKMRIKIEFPADGVNAELHRIEIDIKKQGRT